MSGGAAGSNNWRNPSAAHMQKHSLNPLPDNFEPTVEEQQLLDLYEVVRTQERHAARLKEESARAKLEAAEAEFQQSRGAPAGAKKKNKRKRDKKPKLEAQVAYSDEESSDESSDLESEEEEKEETLHDRREAKLAEMRERNEEKQLLLEGDGKDEALREQLLAETAVAVDDGVTLKRKQRDETENPATSLISNITAAATPPHDFSDKLQLTRVKGTILFPTNTDEFKWQPPEGVFAPNDGAFTVELPGFDVARAEAGQGNNTVAIKFTAPPDSKRFSINLCLTSDRDADFDSVLFHFNPRQRERGGQLVINDKQEGIWGQAIQLPLSQVPLIFGQTACTLMIQINGEGFDIFLENQHCARLEHRRELPSDSTDLVLQFPSTDDYGSPENWSVYKVWWGNKPIMAKGDVSGIPGVNTFNSVHPRKLFISGLSKIFTEQEVDIRKAELERAFRAYGGDRGVSVIVPTNNTYAFVEMESERQCDLALQQMASQYKMNRARRSRHDALLEERAAAEKAKLGEGGIKEATAWD